MNSQYFLDTNVCIEIARGRYPGIQKCMAALSYGEVAICSIVWAELELGARLSPKGYARARA
ncbi:MAG: type II toxin-antitoxin system VapC family toxin [Candidatus Contendobacter sp.]|nr:type II toxin-antitoxin system VapC family toxin [Candidatus Contendobacter sp.]